MISQMREVKTKPGFNFDYFIQQVSPNIPPESGEKAKFFDNLFQDSCETEQQFSEKNEMLITIFEQIFINRKPRRQIWRVHLILPYGYYSEDHEYNNKLIEGLLVLPNEFPKVPPKFYIGRLNDNTRFWHENVLQDGEVCVGIINNWTCNRSLSVYFKSLHYVIYNPNYLDFPANFIFCRQPEIEKRRRRMFQASLLLQNKI